MSRLNVPAQNRWLKHWQTVISAAGAATRRLSLAIALVATVSLVVAVLGLFAQGAMAQSYHLVPLGLVDDEHRADQGHTVSVVQESLPSGVVLGKSFAFNGLGRSGGESIWLHDPRRLDVNVKRLGLLVPEERDANGFFHDYSFDVNAAGMVVGYTDRGFAWYALPLADEAIPLVVNGSAVTDSNLRGLTESNRVIGSGLGVLWSYQPESHAYVEFGLTDIEHVNDQGMGNNSLRILDPQGRIAAGTAGRFLGTETSLGRSGWVADVNTGDTHRVGLRDAEHFAADLFHRTTPSHVNGRGQAAGHTTRYNGPSTMVWGQSAWLFDPTLGDTIKLGFVDESHTGANGQRESIVRFLSERGTVVGESLRYDASGGGNGRSLWRYDGSTRTQRQLGLLDAEHTQRNTGRQDGFALFHSDAGYTVGFSSRYAVNSGAEVGSSAWHDDPATGITRRISPNSAAFTRSDGFGSSQLLQLQENGDTFGTSLRFRGNQPRGQSAWVYREQVGETRLLDLEGDEYVSSDQSRFSNFEEITGSGYASGTSTRYCGDASCGASAWVYDPGTDHVTVVGMYGTRNRNDLGGFQSFVIDVNNRGQAVGYSDAYTTGSSSQQYLDPWMYDHTTGTMHSLRFSQRPDERVNTTIFGISDGGQVLGQYSEFDNLGQSARDVIFEWSVENGVRELDELVAGGISASIFDRIVQFDRQTDPVGQRSGRGEWDPNGNLPLLLRPLIPGDIDGNFQIEVADIDLLSQALRDGMTGWQFDVDGDGLVDEADRVHWVEAIATTVFGDANLDGSFDSTDLVRVFQAGEYDDTRDRNSTWSTGDWTGDGEFDSSDLIVAFQTGAYTLDANGAVQAHSVPEPNSFLPCLLLFTLRRSRRARRVLNHSFGESMRWG
jgi:hypothetical protein